MSEATSNEIPPEIANADAEAQFRSLQPKYEKLATEVEYIIQDALVEERIPVASLSKRVKTLASFADKLRRKSYRDPLSEVTDLAGVRVVSYFRGDLVRLEDMIRRNFQVLEKVDKFADKETDRFGYTAIQFIVSLKEHYLGARYDELHGLKCEIQTRAVLADAWAILNHYLVYKKEDDLPQGVAREVNALAGLVESAESQFEDIRQKIERHRQGAKQTTGGDFLNQPINPSTVAAFIERMFPGIQASDRDKAAASICLQIDQTRFRTLADIETAVRRTKRAVAALKKDTTAFAAQELEYALAFVDPSMRGIYVDWFAALFKKHRHLVEGSDGIDI